MTSGAQAVPVDLALDGDRPVATIAREPIDWLGGAPLSGGPSLRVGLEFPHGACSVPTGAAFQRARPSNDRSAESTDLRRRHD